MNEKEAWLVEVYHECQDVAVQFTVKARTAAEAIRMVLRRAAFQPGRIKVERVDVRLGATVSGDGIPMAN